MKGAHARVTDFSKARCTAVEKKSRPTSSASRGAAFPHRCMDPSEDEDDVIVDIVGPQKYIAMPARVPRVPRVPEPFNGCGPPNFPPIEPRRMDPRRDLLAAAPAARGAYAAPPDVALPQRALARPRGAPKSAGPQPRRWCRPFEPWQLQRLAEVLEHSALVELCQQSGVTHDGVPSVPGDDPRDLAALFANYVRQQETRAARRGALERVCDALDGYIVGVLDKIMLEPLKKVAVQRLDMPKGLKAAETKELVRSRWETSREGPWSEFFSVFDAIVESQKVHLHSRMIAKERQRDRKHLRDPTTGKFVNSKKRPKDDGATPSDHAKVPEESVGDAASAKKKRPGPKGSGATSATRVAPRAGRRGTGTRGGRRSLSPRSEE